LHNLVEVSAFFDKYPVHEAISKILSGDGLSIVLRKTDYGRSFTDFREQHSDCLSKKTTVIILGDAVRTSESLIQISFDSYRRDVSA